MYSDYVNYSNEKLTAMVNSKKYTDEVVEIIEDILLERNALSVNYKQDKEENLRKTEKDTFIKNLRKVREKDVSTYIKKFENYPDKDIVEVITRYTSYQPAAVEAALLISMNRGKISENEKDKLLSQIENELFETELKEEQEQKEKQRKSSSQLTLGLVFTVLGVVLTLWSWSNPMNSTYIIFYGLILSGFILILKGLFG